MKWKSGAAINPAECAAICNPPPVDNYCYRPDENACQYGTLTELGINQAVASTYLNNGTLRSDLTREQCSYLCNDVYVCKNCSPVSVKGRYTSYNECVDAENLYCFERHDSVYESCSTESGCVPDGLSEGSTASTQSFYYCSPLSNNCVKVPQSPFLSEEACEESTGSLCYLRNDCSSECSAGTTFSWCNPDGGCSSGNYPSKADCEKDPSHTTCHESQGFSCSSVCGASGGTGCDLPPDSGNDISVDLEADPQCVPVR
ncbi:MAG TPA: hypothetical protein PLH22_02230, partial [Candidatus Colwellbacteria bacterium]|nr:hypothetical protein [Candidatus Colwellbacteria bacterium]